MTLNAMLAELDPMERTLRLEWLRRRSLAPFIATVLAGTMLIGFVRSVLLGGIVAAVTHVVLRNRLSRELLQGRQVGGHLQPYR